MAMEQLVHTQNYMSMLPSSDAGLIRVHACTGVISISHCLLTALWLSLTCIAKAVVKLWIT